MPKSLAGATATLVLTASLAALLTGCGLAETGAAAATGGVSKAEELRQARETEARLLRQVDAASQQAAEQRSAAETASQ